MMYQVFQFRNIPAAPAKVILFFPEAVMSENEINKTINTVITRRSIRHYSDTPVTDDELTSILAAAMSAPSAGNEQPWEFIIIRDRKTFSSITKFHPYAQMLGEASVAIAVCGDILKEKHQGFWVQDCSAATQNILLAAHALGLGAVWLGIHPIKERVDGLSKLLHLPSNIVPLSLVPVGHPDEEKVPANRFDSSRLHQEKWP